MAKSSKRILEPIEIITGTHVISGKIIKKKGKIIEKFNLESVSIVQNKQHDKTIF